MPFLCSWHIFLKMYRYIVQRKKMGINIFFHLYFITKYFGKGIIKKLITKFWGILVIYEDCFSSFYIFIKVFPVTACTVNLMDEPNHNCFLVPYRCKSMKIHDKSSFGWLVIPCLC